MSSLQFIESATAEVVRGNKQRSTSPLIDSNADRPPKAEDVVMLMPRAPVVRRIDIGALVEELVDRECKIRMQPRGCRWWNREVRNKVSKDGRVPVHLCRMRCPP